MKRWPTKPLKNIAAVVRGVSFDKTQVSDLPRKDSVPILRAGNIQTSLLTDSDLVYVSTQLVSAEQRMRRGDLAICMSSGSPAIVGKSAHLENDWAGSVGAFCAIVRFAATFHHRLGSYWFRSPAFFQWRDCNAKGANIQNLRRSDLECLSIPVPPLAEQERIVRLLDEADALRKLRAQADNRTSELLPALFHEMFGDPAANTRRWKRHTLIELLSGIDSGWSPTCHDRPAQPDEWGVLKLGAVTSCQYFDTESKALPEDLTPRSELEVKPGDLLFTRKNTYALVAACAFVFDTRPKLMLSDLLFRLRLKHDAEVEPIFLWGLLTTPSKRKQVQSLASGSAGSMPNISKSRLMTLPVEIPPLPLQQEFAWRVTEIRELETAQTGSRQRLEDLFQSLLHRAFNGDL
jgi:type I restriction enzyme S subunit